MPISPIVLQRRHAELGRIRLGAKRNGNGSPMKLEQFRFTTHSERYAHDLAELYGGEAKPWDNGGVASWEVYSTARSIPVIAVKGGLSQWMETWSGGGCVHRCDGETNVLTGDACDPQDRNHVNAKPTTRLSVMLPELEAIGVWRMESHGWNAAAEIPAVAELAQYVGDLVPANLHLVERRSIKDGKTSRFVVPVLDLQIGTSRLRELVNAKMEGRELEAPAEQPAALESPKQEHPAEAGAQVAIPTPEQIAGADLDRLRAMVAYLREHDMAEHPATKAALARLVLLEADSVKKDWDDAEAESVATETVGPDADQVWDDILKAGGQRGMSLPDIEQDVAGFLNGGDVDGPNKVSEASGEELQAYLNILVERAA